LPRPRGFEPLTPGLEMRGFVVTSCIVLLIYNNYLQRVYENGLKTHFFTLRNMTMTLT